MLAVNSVTAARLFTGVDKLAGGHTVIMIDVLDEVAVLFVARRLHALVDAAVPLPIIILLFDLINRHFRYFVSTIIIIFVSMLTGNFF